MDPVVCKSPQLWDIPGDQVLYCTVLNCTVLYCTVLYCTVQVREYSLVCSRAGLRTLVNLTYMMGRGTYTVSYHLLSYARMSLDSLVNLLAFLSIFDKTFSLN